MTAQGPGCYGCGANNSAGLRLTFERDGDHLIASFLPRAEHRGPPGHLHGGIAATCLDEVMAALGHALDGVHSVTATLDVRFRKPIPLDGRPLRLESWRDHVEARRRQRVHGRLLLADGTIAAQARGIFVQVGP